MPKNYYLVLGVPADSSQREIKVAFRRLAKEFHPDRCSDRHILFLSIQEAYSVLRDPARRKEYDEMLREAGRKPPPRRTAPPRKRAYPSSPEIVEPLIPERPPVFGHEREDFLRHSDFRSLVEQVFGGFSGRGQGAIQENPVVEVALASQQAERGGVIRLSVPGFYQCPACAGSGERGLFLACPHCGGTGANSYDYPLRIEFPPGVPDNYVLRVPLDIFGRPHSWLTVRFRIR